MARPHAEVERERRMVLAVIGATGETGVTAKAIREALAVSMGTVRNRLRELEQGGLIHRAEKQERIDGKWWILWVRS